MDCIITAGGMPRLDDPIYAYTQGKPKALLDMAGRSMLERVVDALQSSRYVDDIVVVGLGNTGHETHFQFQRPVVHLPDHGSLIDNAMAGLQWSKAHNPGATELLLSSADLPTLTSDIVDHFVESCRPFDNALYYTFVTQEVMEARFPHSNRTFVQLKDIRIAGGDLFLAHPTIGDSHRELWESLANARKHAWKLAWTIGPRALLKFMLRRIGPAEIEAEASRILRRPVKIILSPHAELAMDADKPHQIDLLRRELAQDPHSDDPIIHP